LESIIAALNYLNKTQKVVLPVHPRTKNAIKKDKIITTFDLIPPVSYLDMIELLKNCSLVITDSGGLQKESYFAGKFCVTLRDETEWVELINEGVSFISGAHTNTIITLVKDLMNKESDFNGKLYGNGEASAMIVEELAKA
jgi:UDP-GlcNAc3NAcA epimerase